MLMGGTGLLPRVPAVPTDRAVCVPPGSIPPPCILQPASKTSRGFTAPAATPHSPDEEDPHVGTPLTLSPLGPMSPLKPGNPSSP